MLFFLTHILMDEHLLQALHRNYKHLIEVVFYFRIVFTLIIMCRNLY